MAQQRSAAARQAQAQAKQAQIDAITGIGTNLGGMSIPS